MPLQLWEFDGPVISNKWQAVVNKGPATAAYRNDNYFGRCAVSNFTAFPYDYKY